MKLKAIMLVIIGTILAIISTLTFLGKIPAVTLYEIPIVQGLISLLGSVATFLYLEEFTYGIIRGVIKKQKMQNRS